MIQVRNLRKTYGEIRAVDDISFDIASGEAFALLGPNGAGKTTTIHMLVGLLTPDAGEIQIHAETDPTQPRLRREIGIVPQTLAIYDELTATENLAFFGRLYGLTRHHLAERIDWCLAFAGLVDRRHERVDRFSGGMKRRLNLACALVHEPRVLFCDEPTVGVDPQSRNHIFDSIGDLRRGGCTLVYTTHYMEEAQRLCDRVAIMDHGKILALDTVAGLLQAHGGTALVEAELVGVPDGDPLPGEVSGNRLRIETDHPLEQIAELGRRNVELLALRVERPDLERVFLHLTGRSLRD